MIHTSWWTLKRRYLQAVLKSPSHSLTLFQTLLHIEALWVTGSWLWPHSFCGWLHRHVMSVSLVQSITKCNREKQTRTGMSVLCRVVSLFDSWSRCKLRKQIRPWWKTCHKCHGSQLGMCKLVIWWDVKMRSPNWRSSLHSSTIYDIWCTVIQSLPSMIQVMCVEWIKENIFKIYPGPIGV